MEQNLTPGPYFTAYLPSVYTERREFLLFYHAGIRILHAVGIFRVGKKPVEYPFSQARTFRAKPSGYATKP